MEAERDQLKRSQLELVLDIQRRNGLKEALLQKKVSALSLELQNKEVRTKTRTEPGLGWFYKDTTTF